MTPLPCPSCRARLQIPPGLASKLLTCPRCLAGIQNPHAAPTIPPPDPTSKRPCPMCAEDIDTRARICPICGEPLDAETVAIEVDVARDNTLLTVGLLGLATLGALGIAHILFVHRSSMHPVRWSVLIAIFVGVVGAGIALNLKKHDPVARGVGRAILGTLATAGALIVLAFLLAIATLIYLFVVCLTGGMKL